MSHRYDNGWNNWHSNWHNHWHGSNGPNGWNSWGYWKAGNPNWGYYTHYHHVPRRFGCFKKILVLGVAFWAGGAYMRHSLKEKNRGCENQQSTVQQTPAVDQSTPVNQAAPLQQQSQNKNELDYKKTWISWAKCRAENTQFLHCLNKNDGEIGICQPFFDMIKECEKKYL